MVTPSRFAGRGCCRLRALTGSAPTTCPATSSAASCSDSGSRSTCRSPASSAGTGGYDHRLRCRLRRRLAGGDADAPGRYLARLSLPAARHRRAGDSRHRHVPGCAGARHCQHPRVRPPRPGAAPDREERDYVLAARCLGASPPRIIGRHIATNALPPLLVQAALAMAFAVIAEATLSFLGLGASPPTPTLGIILNDGRRWLLSRLLVVRALPHAGAVADSALAQLPRRLRRRSDRPAPPPPLERPRGELADITGGPWFGVGVRRRRGRRRRPGMG